MSGRSDFTSAVTSVSWRRSCQLRVKKMSPPVSGCCSRRRSSSLRLWPAMSRMTGEWWLISGGFVVLLDDHEGRRVFGFVADRHVRRVASGFAPGGQRAVQPHDRLAAALVEDLAGAPRHRHAHAESD